MTDAEACKFSVTETPGGGKDFPAAIAIDGPAASGKTTIGRMLADYLGYLFLDTGCMYRAATVAVLRETVPIDDEAAVVAVTKALALDIRPPGEHNDGRLYTVILDGKDITWDLRSSDVDSNVSQLSAYAGVRENLVNRQRAIAKRGRVVMVGRDIGTVVLPNAPLKLYVIASAEERAHRRWAERRDRDPTSSYDQILSDLVRRDRFDGSRLHSPMRPANDAIIIDTTGRSAADIVAQIIAMEGFQHHEASGSV